MKKLPYSPLTQLLGNVYLSDTLCPYSTGSFVGTSHCEGCAYYVGKFKNENAVYCEADESVKRRFDERVFKYKPKKFVLIEKSLMG
jgi:hypothetical protein